jgi:predicted dehydrogenase
MIRAAIIGLGWWGRTIVETVQGKSDRISFVAGNTRTRAKAEEFCRDNKIELRDDLDSILNDPRIDAVVYTTPHSQHEEHIRRAAQAGKHVCVEKPFTLKAHTSGQPQVIENKGPNPVKWVMEAFAAAVQGEAPFPITHEQIIHGVAVFEAIVKSAKTGQLVKVG